MPTPGLRWPKAGEPRYCRVDHAVAGSPSWERPTSRVFSGSPSPFGSKTVAPTIGTSLPAVGLAAAAALLDGAVAVGVDPRTSVTSFATESTLEPSQTARPM